MAFEIILSDRAFSDLEEIADETESGERLAREVLRKIRCLETEPRVGEVLKRQGDPDYRTLLHSPYKILYEVSDRDRTVTICRFWHVSRGAPQF